VNSEELEKKIIEIKKRGLNILIENELIADARSQYYKKLIDKRINAISNQVRKNVIFLGSFHKNNVSRAKVKEFMGMDVDQNFNKILYEDYKLSSLRTGILISEFYGIPVDLLLFQDLEANAETFKQLYPAIFRQSRN